MRPAPGWCVVREVQTEETYAGSTIIIPDNVRDRVARYQAEIVDVSPKGTFCDDPDCDRPHGDEHHPIPVSVKSGSWVILEPRSLVGIPGVFDQWLVPIDHIWAVIEG